LLRSKNDTPNGPAAQCGACAIPEVPSAIVPEEPACVLNPNHADSAAFTATVVRAFEYDLLFRS